MGNNMVEFAGSPFVIVLGVLTLAGQMSAVGFSVFTQVLDTFVLCFCLEAEEYRNPVFAPTAFSAFVAVQEAERRLTRENTLDEGLTSSRRGLLGAMEMSNLGSENNSLPTASVWNLGNENNPLPTASASALEGSI
eukprot:Trichotokara_eunicae@DN4024_c0_g1_i3.p1